MKLGGQFPIIKFLFSREIAFIILISGKDITNESKEILFASDYIWKY